MDVLIVGASARAACQSARRAGMAPAAADLFGDLDARAAADPFAVVDPTAYPNGIATAVASWPPTPFLFTGGLENHPELLAGIALRHPLLGGPIEAIRAVRDPNVLARIWRAAGIPSPAVSDDPAGLPTDGTWLIKPIRSAGARGVRPWRGGRFPPASYLQERVPGRSISATYLMLDGRSTLLGIAYQILQRRRREGALRWAGNVAPVRPHPGLRERLIAVGAALAAAVPLRGLVGVDLVGRGDDVRPVEVNPRYTASVELFERSTGRSWLAWHREACLGRFPIDDGGTGAAPWLEERARLWIKRIVYARAESRWTKDLADHLAQAMPGVEAADLPAFGTMFSAGRPIITLIGPKNAFDPTRGGMR